MLVIPLGARRYCIWLLPTQAIWLIAHPLIHCTAASVSSLDRNAGNAVIRLPQVFDRLREVAGRVNQVSLIS